MAKAVFSHPSGATLPPSPVLYYFTPAPARRATLLIRANNRTVPARVTLVSNTKAFAAYRVEVRIKRAAKLIVTPMNGAGTEYFVDPNWRGPAKRTVRVRSTKRAVSRWTCSFTNAHMVTLSPAPAYRVEWARSRRALDSGKGTAVVFPGHTDEFWGRHAAGSVDGKVGLGHLSCFGWTTPKLSGAYVRIHALYPDGKASSPTTVKLP